MKNKITIKQLADELGLPKNKINYQVSKLNSEFIVKINGVKYLTIEGQEAIKQSIGIKLDTKLNTNLDSFKHQIEHLKQQLKVKDEQINKLHELLDHQQQLQLKTQQILEDKTKLLELKTKKWYQFWKS